MKKILKQAAFKILPPGLLLFIKKKHFLRKLKRAKITDYSDLSVLRMLVKPGDVVADIGANFGLYTKFLSLLATDSGRVYSFEPIPETFKILENNIRKLNFENTTAFNFALSDKSGQVTMVIPDEEESGSPNFYEAKISDTAENGLSIQATTIDDFFYREKNIPSFIKIDVEGHELNCINGGSHIISTFKPKLFIEVSGNPDVEGTHAHRLFEILIKQEYKVYYFKDDKLKERKPGDAAVNYVFLPFK